MIEQKKMKNKNIILEPGNCEHKKKSFQFIRILLMIFICYLMADNVNSQTLISLQQSIGSKIRKQECYSSVVQKTKNIIQEHIKKYKIPGLGIALVDKKGVIWSDEFGVQDTLSQIPVNSETLFCIASVTKPITSTIILKAVELGILDLDVPIIKYIPEIKFYSKYEKFPERKITIRHLLTHRAGLTHEAPFGNNWDGIDCTLEEHVKSIYGTWLKHPVGQRNDYSGSGFDLAAYILQRVLSKSYEECAKELLFDKLEMNSTTVDRNIILYDKNRALGHTKRYKNAPPQILPMHGGGSVYSTAGDMAKFIQFHLNYGKINREQYLDSSLVTQIHNIQWYEKSQVNGSGLGINRWYNFGGKYIRQYRLIHTGGGFGYGAVIEWFPEYDIGITILANLWGVDLTEIADNLLQMIFDDLNVVFEENKIIAKVVKNSKRTLPNQDFSGNYGVFTVSFNGNKSSIKIGHEETIPLIFISPASAYYERKPNQYNILKFFKGAKNQNDYAMSMTRGFMYNKIETVNTPGPNKTEWQNYIGEYKRMRWGQITDTMKVTLKNGYLYLDNVLLDEADKGLFYQINNNWMNSEIIQFKNDTMIYRNIIMYKVE